MPKTVTLDMARRLKEAGLQWEPKIGDWLIYKQQELLVLQVKDHDLFVASDVQRFIIYEYPEVSLIWHPTLSDLLGWLEGKGYFPRLRKEAGFGYVVDLSAFIKTVWHSYNSWEDAAGEAVLFELQRGKEANHD